ncbi:hypothetical protein [Larkinella terrae]|uniref:Uncharacterized protein n=1 Tax=Larkinella terrae TaxID=2025311 RepID=A0A7K0EIW6_9BACT|nr:hypothetical protein [Larkinella terrae]MRS61789.1 hypothetical protein [Larkinella terrae]
MESFIILAVGWLIGAFFCGLIGKNRECGFGEPFLLSFFLSPFIGAVDALASKRLEDIAFQKRTIELLKQIAEQTKPTVIDEE